MVTVAVIGHRGMLGRVVARRFAEHGATVWTTEMRYPLALVAWARHADLIVNCAYEPGDWHTNAELPVLLARAGRLIQPSTDAIAEDSEYAAEKRMAETARAIILRCSIVGSGPPPPVAYTNWTWNGVTTLTWADVAWEARKSPPCTIIPGTGPISREALGVAVAAVFGYPAPEARQAPEALDRTLAVTWPTPPIRAQLMALRDWERT